MPSVPSIPQKQGGFHLRWLGMDISIAKALPAPTPTQPSSWGRGGWFPVVREAYPGAWQRNMEIRPENVLTYSAVYACVTLIAADVSKCRVRLVEMDENGIWEEVDAPSFSPVLRKPNAFQNRIKFYEQWIISKLLHGNTYVLKQRDGKGNVVAMYILDPTRTKALVASNGDIYYQLSQDNLAGVEQNIIVPQREIIHDVMTPLYHPLCGVSPLTASGIAALQGLSIQKNSTYFFSSGSRPGGVLTAPGPIKDEDAQRMKEYWEANFSGENAGRVAVLGDGLKFESMSVKAVDAQLIEQLQWTAQTVCSTFHVPAYMVGVGEMPPYNNINALYQMYYSQCLQKLFEAIEICLDEGLALNNVPGKKYGTEFDLDDLLRMDNAALIESEKVAVGAGIKKIDEARKRLNLAPIPGGNTAYLQEQNFSLTALAKRDAKEDPWAAAPTAAPEPPEQGDELDEAETEERARNGAVMLRKLLEAA